MVYGYGVKATIACELQFAVSLPQYAFINGINSSPLIVTISGTQQGRPTIVKFDWYNSTGELGSSESALSSALRSALWVRLARLLLNSAF